MIQSIAGLDGEQELEPKVAKFTPVQVELPLTAAALVEFIGYKLETILKLNRSGVEMRIEVF